MKRLFIDSSVLFSAAYSEKGYSRDLILLAVREQVLLVISNFVIEETRRNLEFSAPQVIPSLERVFALLPFEIVDPAREAVLDAARLVALKDAPILAAAKLARVDVLVSLDKRHILDRPELQEYISGKILRPKEAYEWVTAPK